MHQALALRKAIAEKCTWPGYALVMVHRTADNRDGAEDQLAAMVVRELRQRCDIRAAVIHSEVPSRAYEEDRGKDGRVIYRCATDQQKRLSGKR